MGGNDAVLAAELAVDVYVLPQKVFALKQLKKCCYFVPCNLNHSEWH